MVTNLIGSARLGALTILASAVAVLTACGEASLTLADDAMGRGDAFVKVSRHKLLADGGAGGVTSGDDESFYLAISKKELHSRWFMSAYLTQWHPSENVPMRSLGTRVVTFKLQNGKLFVFDATDGKAWSDSLDPTVVVEAYPVVTDYAPFNLLPSSSNYVLFDPSAGLNRFSFVSDDFAANYWARFQVDLSYLQNYEPLADGVRFEQVFTGYTEVPGPGVLAYEQPFRGSGTLGVSLRRYEESAGFTPTELAHGNRRYFGSSNWQYIKNEAGLRRYAVKWNVQYGMAPIEWRISNDVAALQSDPRLAGVDVYGAIERGIEGWNATFGFPVFEVVPTSATDFPGDDEKNFVVVDRNPWTGYAFANWRENPNTGEIRGASVYFSSTFIERALAEPAEGSAKGTSPGDAGTLPAACNPGVVVSQLFGGNTSTGVYSQDYVELHNRTGQSVSLEGWSVQYASATGSSWQVAPLSGAIAPGGYFLIGLSHSGADAGTSLPTADAQGSINLSSASGKVALVQSTHALSGFCPGGAPVVDLVGYGSATCAEGAAAPATSSSVALFRDASGSPAACMDSQNNALDFTTGVLAPRNSQSPAQLCACTTSSTTPPAITADGGTLLPAPNGGAAALRMSWDAMPAASVCTLQHDLSRARIPHGMTQSQFVEAAITHTIAHEIGHTLGLRHNFRGSLTSSSLMDYLAEEEGALLTSPGPYDIDAIRHLYGISTNEPSQPFCSDEDHQLYADCDVWDRGTSPLIEDVGPRFNARLTAFIAGTGGFSFSDIWTVTRYVRGPGSEQERVEAFDILMGQVAPPLPPSVSGLSNEAAAYADGLATLFLENLFLDPVDYRDGIAISPSLYDASFRARVIEVTSQILVNSDAVRSFHSRRIAVDVLKALQTQDAYEALLTARTQLVAERAQQSASQQALIDDLIKRLDLACSPYYR